MLAAYQVRPRFARPAAVVAAVFSTAAAVLVAVFLTRGNAQVEPVAQNQPYFQVKRLDEMEFDLAKWSNVPLVGPMLVAMSDGDDTTDPYAELAKDTGRSLAGVVLRLPSVAGPRGVRPPTSVSMNANGVWPTTVSEELRPGHRIGHRDVQPAVGCFAAYFLVEQQGPCLLGARRSPLRFLAA